ncbi:MAG: HD domain-containing protein [Synergistaceae bacterium]|jgi:HD-GYP domain-containing protein (c-di-GMP phosphodiesterase class II)|nr:HD domain-containing protein [Synergistaceae bacterium]
MKKRVWNVALGELLNVEGIVAEDVVSRNQAVILPGGVSLPALRETRPEIVSLLLKHGITHVKVKSVPTITASEFRTALSSIVPSVAELNPLLTQIAIHQFGAIYRNIEDRTMRERGIRTMMMIASRLPREIRRTSQITLSLVGAEERERERAHIHSINVALLTGYIAQKVFPVWPAFVEACIRGGLFHDVGKAFFPQFVWEDASGMKRGGKIFPGEAKIFNCHPLLGETLLKDTDVRDLHVLGAVRSHHEKWSGNGVPDRLKGEDIPMSGRIVAVADAFENLTSRFLEGDVYRSDQAISTMIGLTNSDFDSRIVRALLSAIGLYPPGTVVLLSDQRVGIVLETKERDLLCPRVLICVDALGRRVSPFETLKIRKEGNIYIKEALDDFSKRKLEPYVPVSMSSRLG